MRDGHPYPVDLESALTGSGSGRIVLHSNDIVVVPEKGGYSREALAVLLSLLTVSVSVVNLIVTLRR